MLNKTQRHEGADCFYVRILISHPKSWDKLIHGIGITLYLVLVKPFLGLGISLSLMLGKPIPGVGKTYPGCWYNTFQELQKTLYQPLKGSMVIILESLILYRS